ncbi:hypothetical protein Dimus_036459 [Dionaea muscipula]
MVFAFPTPEHYQFGLPEPGKSVVDYIDQDTLCIHLKHFTRGLRLPLPYLLIQLLNRHDLLLTQLTPNATSYILAFIILCEDKAVKATSCLFDTVFSLVEEPEKMGYCTVEPKAGFKLVQDLPETPVIWKRKFITVRSRDWPHEHFTLYQYATPWVKVNKFNLWNRNEKRALDFFLLLDHISLFGMRENASAMLLAVWHDRFKAEACSDEAAQEEHFDSAGSWKWKGRKFRDEIKWLIRILSSSR